MGIGTSLSEYCLEKAKEVGYEQIELSVVNTIQLLSISIKKWDLSYVRP